MKYLIQASIMASGLLLSLPSLAEARLGDEVVGQACQPGIARTRPASQYIKTTYTLAGGDEVLGAVTDKRTGLTWTPSILPYYSVTKYNMDELSQYEYGSTEWSNAYYIITHRAYDEALGIFNENNHYARYLWADALKLAQDANRNNYLGYSDWRLPNIKELYSLVDRTCINPAMSDVFILGGTQDWTDNDFPTWSSTEINVIYFSSGQESMQEQYNFGPYNRSSDKQESYGYVRLVRGPDAGE